MPLLDFYVTYKIHNFIKTNFVKTPYEPSDNVSDTERQYSYLCETEMGGNKSTWLSCSENCNFRCDMIRRLRIVCFI